MFDKIVSIFVFLLCAMHIGDDVIMKDIKELPVLEATRTEAEEMAATTVSPYLPSQSVAPFLPSSSSPSSRSTLSLSRLSTTGIRRPVFDSVTEISPIPAPPTSSESWISYLIVGVFLLILSIAFVISVRSLFPFARLHEQTQRRIETENRYYDRLRYLRDQRARKTQPKEGSAQKAQRTPQKLSQVVLERRALLRRKHLALEESKKDAASLRLTTQELSESNRDLNKSNQQLRSALKTEGTQKSEAAIRRKDLEAQVQDLKRSQEKSVLRQNDLKAQMEDLRKSEEDAVSRHNEMQDRIKSYLPLARLGKVSRLVLIKQVETLKERAAKMQEEHTERTTFLDDRIKAQRATIEHLQSQLDRTRSKPQLPQWIRAARTEDEQSLNDPKAAETEQPPEHKDPASEISTDQPPTDHSEEDAPIEPEPKPSSPKEPGDSDVPQSPAGWDEGFKRRYRGKRAGKAVKRREARRERKAAVEAGLQEASKASGPLSLEASRWAQ